MLDANNTDLVHHLLLYECDPTAVFDDNNLPEGSCDEVYWQMALCFMNVAGGWAVGADTVSPFFYCIRCLHKKSFE